MRASDQKRMREGRKRRARRVCALAAALSLLVGCAQDPQDEARQEWQTLASWTATLHLLADSWREGSVPTRYAKKSAEAAHETLQKELQSVQKSSTLPADGRALIVERARSLDELSLSLAQAMQSEDRVAAQQLVESLAREEQSLKDLAREGGRAK
jgi:hypothetical protein